MESALEEDGEEGSEEGPAYLADESRPGESRLGTDGSFSSSNHYEN